MVKRTTLSVVAECGEFPMHTQVVAWINMKKFLTNLYFVLLLLLVCLRRHDNDRIEDKNGTKAREPEISSQWNFFRWNQQVSSCDLFKNFSNIFFFGRLSLLSFSLSVHCGWILMFSHYYCLFRKNKKKKAAPTEWAAQNEKNNRKMREERPTYSVRHWRDLLERNTRPRVEPEKISSQNEVKQRVFSRSFTSTTKTNKRQQVCHWSQVLVRSLLCSFA